MGKRSGSGSTNTASTGNVRASGRTVLRSVSVAALYRQTSGEMSNMQRANVEWWKGEIQRKGINAIEPPRIGLTADGKRTVINGRHRLTAAKELGLKSIKVRIDK